jgi:hypothetical protein
MSIKYSESNNRYDARYDTGEIETDIREGDRILRGQSTERLTNLIKINDKRPFVKVYIDSISEIAKDGELRGADYTVLFSMMPYIRFETGLIAHDNGRYMRGESIIPLTGLAGNTVYKSLEHLVKKRIFAKVRTGRDIKLYANPYIFMRGREVNRTLESMFRNTKYEK